MPRPASALGSRAWRLEAAERGNCRCIRTTRSAALLSRATASLRPLGDEAEQIRHEADERGEVVEVVSDPTVEGRDGKPECPVEDVHLVANKRALDMNQCDSSGTPKIFTPSDVGNWFRLYGLVSGSRRRGLVLARRPSSWRG